jgi:glycosyltransferase involved in cell wall biosynthesis
VELSVVICTHNPKPPYLRRVLDALRHQSLPKDQWELLLIDNASSEAVAPSWDLSWHPNGRHVLEEKLGLTNARARGLVESSGNILVYVDDDNVLAKDYLAEAARIFQQWPMLGAIGAGICKGEFEVPPPESIQPYLAGLAVRELDRSYWSNLSDFSLALPFGAGLAVRREVAEDYANKVATTPLRQMLGRTGKGLGSGDDSDLAFCAHDLGLGTARFISLQLVHLIPKERLTEDYIVRLNAGFARSGEVLHALRNHGLRHQDRPPLRQLRYFYNFWKKKGMEKNIYRACEKERQNIRRQIDEALRQARP